MFRLVIAATFLSMSAAAIKGASAEEQVRFNSAGTPPTAFQIKRAKAKGVEAKKKPGDEIERLRAELARYREALEEIRDQTFEQTNPQRLIDQLWHFVRWSKATARSALGQPGERDKK